MASATKPYRLSSLTWPFLLLVVALLYYSAYYDCGFRIGDEGADVLTSQRLLAGERPYLDVTPAYGPLWYYPIALLFGLTGTSFLATRLYFLALATGTALLAYFFLARETGKARWAALLVLLVIAFPGSLHKTYIPLIVVANMMTIHSALGSATGHRARRILVAATVAAISWHLRADLGFFASAALVATVTAQDLAQFSGWRARGHRLLADLGVLSAGAALPTLPLFFVAYRQGLLRPYLHWLGLPFEQISTLVARWLPLLGSRESPSAAGHRTGFAPFPLDAVLRPGPERLMALLTYLPVFALALLGLWIAVRAAKNLTQGKAEMRDTLSLVAASTLTYSALPAFLLHRPDPSHLSQFMVGYLVLTGLLLGRRWSAGATPALCVLLLNSILYAGYAIGHEATGSIALRKDRTELLRAENGVVVRLRPDEKRRFAHLMKAALENTEPGEVILCLPYCPGLNVMVNRPTRARDLFVPRASPDWDQLWQEATVRLLRTERPPLIVVRDWAINRSEASRFPVWAKQVQREIERSYSIVRKIDDYTVYAPIAELPRAAVAAQPSTGTS